MKDYKNHAHTELNSFIIKQKERAYKVERVCWVCFVLGIFGITLLQPRLLNYLFSISMLGVACYTMYRCWIDCLGIDNFMDKLFD